MHIENELAEIVTTSEPEFEEFVDEYEEEILMQGEVLVRVANMLRFLVACVTYRYSQ